MRSQDLFEVLEGYEAAEPLPPPRLTDPEDLRRLGVQPTLISRLALGAAWRISGLTRLAATPPAELAERLRRADTRTVWFPPVISATIPLRDDPRRPDMVTRAASLVAAARSLCDDVAAARLSQDRLGDHPLEMGLYPNLFNTWVDVTSPRSRLRKGAARDRIAVACRRDLFAIDVPTDDADAVAGALDGVLEAPRSGVPVGWLGAMKASRQAEAFGRLGTDPVNAASLGALGDVLVTVCLEPDMTSDSYGDLGRTVHAGHVANRWWNSSLQIVVLGDASAAIICNYRCWLDGNVMTRAGAEMQRRAADIDVRRAPARSVTPLRWRVASEEITAAERHVREVVDDDPDATFSLGVGRRELGRSGLRPVTLFVAALAGAVESFTGDVPHVRQFLSYSRYRCVGVSAATSVTTPEMLAFLEALRSDASDAECHRRLVAVSEADRTLLTRARRRLPIEDLQLVHHRVGGGGGRIGRSAEARTLRWLARRGLYQPIPEDVFISFPGDHPELNGVGRGGVRLPYARRFGMHYVLDEDRTRFTISRGYDWPVANRDFAVAIEERLRRIAAVVASAADA